MTPTQSEGELRKLLGTPLDRLAARAGIDTMLSFYANQRAQGVIDEEDGDMLLLQWGTYSFSGSPTFRVNVTRQFMLPDEDEPYQLSLTFHYAPIEKLSSVPTGNRWCHSRADLDGFRQFVTQLPALSAVEQLKPSCVELTFSAT